LHALGTTDDATVVGTDEAWDDEDDEGEYEDDSGDHLERYDVEHFLGLDQFPALAVAETTLGGITAEEFQWLVFIVLDGGLEAADTAWQDSASGLCVIDFCVVDDLAREVLDLDLAERLDVDITEVPETGLDSDRTGVEQ
jgi:hypothetical protein